MVGPISGVSSKLFDAGSAQSGEAAKCPGQGAGHGRAYMANAEGKKHPVEGLLLAASEAVEEVLR